MLDSSPPPCAYCGHVNTDVRCNTVKTRSQYFDALTLYSLSTIYQQMQLARHNSYTTTRTHSVSAPKCHPQGVVEQTSIKLHHPTRHTSTRSACTRSFRIIQERRTYLYAYFLQKQLHTRAWKYNI